MFKVIEEQGRTWLKEVDYKLCRSVDQLEDFLFSVPLLPTKHIGADWEYNSQNRERALPVGCSFSTSKGKAIYVPVGHKVGPELNLPLDRVLQVLQRLDIEEFISIWHHFRSDSEFMLRHFKWEPTHFEDSMFADYLDNPNFNVYNLKDIIRRRYQLDSIDFEEVAKGRTLDLVHPEDLVDYGCQDADFARRVFLEPHVQASLKEQEFIYRLEKQVLYEVRTGESNKTYLDKEKLIELKADVDRKVAPLLGKIYELAGGEFLVDSPVRLGEKLAQLGIPFTEKDRTKKTGQISTKKETLEKYQAYHPIIPLVIQHKVLTTQLRNYVDKMIGAVEHFGPLVRFPFHQVGVPTGRMKAGGEGNKSESYDKGVVPVNIQSLPDHEKAPYLPNIRSAVVANPPGQDDFVIVAVDYSQVELRIAANMSREPTWIKTFSEGGDIHLTNAKLAYRDYKMAKSDPRRKRGKTMSFAILYGGSEYTVAQHGGITIEQGKLLVDNFFAGAPQLKAWIDSWIKMARQQKFVKTTFGRKRPLEEYYANDSPRWLKMKGDREAINDPIQGGAADIFKIGMVKLGKVIRANNWQQDLQQTLWIHDEFVLRVRKSMLEQMIPEIVKCLEFDVKGWPVKLKVDVEVGANWGEMVPWSVYQALGERSISLAPWNDKKATLFKEHGVGIFSHLDGLETDEVPEASPVLDRTAYGY